MSRKEFFLIAAGFIVLFSITFYVTQCNEHGCFANRIAQHPIPKNFQECAEAGNVVLPTDPRRCILIDGTVFMESLILSSAASAPAVDTTDIRVQQPVPNASIGLPLIIRGKAHTAANQINFRLRDVDGTILKVGLVRTQSPDEDSYAGFDIEEPYPEAFGNTGTIEVFAISPESGAEMGMVKIPVQFAQVPADTVSVFFMDLKADPDRSHCEQVSPFRRRVPASAVVQKSALDELLRGPTLDERHKGAQTALPNDVTISSFDFRNGVVTVDFDPSLLKGISGCRLTALKAQISQTLEQFSNVSSLNLTAGRVPLP